jgi:gliding motility-associated-like protein
LFLFITNKMATKNTLRSIFAVLCLVFSTYNSYTQNINTFTGNGQTGNSGDNGPALNAMISSPLSVCSDNSGNIFVVSGNKVRKITNGIITTIAGNGSFSNKGDGGPAINSYLNQPQSVAVDKAGNLFISEGGSNSIRKVSTTTGIITTIVGDGYTGFTGDGGLAVNARLNLPRGLCVDSDGNLYIADVLNHRIRKIDAKTGIISTVAGNGISTVSSGDGGVARNAAIPYPMDVCTDNKNNLYITEEFPGTTSRVRKVDINTGLISTIAGNGIDAYGGDGGPAINASLNQPRGVAVDAIGNIYIAEYVGCRIRKVNAPTGIISTIAGNGTRSYSGDGGPAVNAALYYPMDVCFDNNGMLYIADMNNNRIRNINLNITPCTPAISITASANNICYGTSVTFTATITNGGTNPVYEWKKNGTVVGTSTSTHTSNTLLTGDVISCTLISNDACVQNLQVISNSITMAIKQDIIPEVIVVASADTICVGTNLKFTATNKSGNPNPVFQWIVDGKDVGTNNTVYTTNTLANGSVVQCRMTVPQCVGTTKDYSDPITMVVNPILNPSVTISASSASICKGTPVVFTATANQSGNATVYQWKINGNNIGTNNRSYTTSTLNNGDIISCVITVDPSAKCAANTNAVSNSITVRVTAPLNTAIQITASDNNICGSKPITFSASSRNVGSATSYQWLLNGNKASSDSISYTNNLPSNGDQVKFMVTSLDTGCSITKSDTSNTISVSIKPVPVISISPLDTTVAFGSVVHLLANTSTVVTSFTWSPAAGLTSQTLSPVTIPLQTTTKYKLDVVSSDGCAASKEATIKVLTGLYMPNSFTPNGDGKNDLFRIPVGMSLQLKEFSVFNRWGKRIFSTNDISAGWDGNFHNLPLNPDTYTYVISGLDYQKQSVFLKGTIVLIR